MTAAISAPITAVVASVRRYFPMLLGFAVLVLWKHRENILRLRKGTEPRIGNRRPRRPPEAAALARHRAGHLSPADRPLRNARGGARRRARPRPARRRQGAGAAHPRPRPSARSRRVEKLGARYLALGQGLYPRLLAELEDAPPLLIAKGNLNLLDRQAVAIVGARNASAAACRFARGLAHDLGQEGLVVVSGLARGIDSAAHDGALETGTIGVHRRRHRHLLSARKRGAADGACTNAAWSSPKCRRAPSRARAHFPVPQPDHRRDQQRDGGGRGGAAIGLADHRAAGGGSGARGDGGARLAARSARAGLQPADPRRRDADPDRRGRGRGDPAVREPACASAPAPLRARRRSTSNGDDALGLVEELLGPSPVPVDEIIRLSGAPSGAVQMALLELDLAGRLDRHAGGKVSLRPA